MKILLSFFVCMVLWVSSAGAAMRVEQYRHLCEHGSAMLEFIVFIVFDSDTGSPISASGVDCNGTAWSVMFCTQAPSAQGPRAFIQSMSASALSVTSHTAVDVQIVNLGTGQYEGDVHHLSGSGQVTSLDVSHLGRGMYAVVSSVEGEATSLAIFMR